MAKKDKVELDGLKGRLEQIFGKGSIVKANTDSFVKVREVTPTGSLTLDLATKIGGVPKGGLLTHILGKESSGKTSLCLHIIAEEQKKGNPCAFLDIEGTFDPVYAASIGVDLDLLYLVDQESMLKSLKLKDRNVISGQEWLDVVIKLLQMDEFGIIVLDSVATLTPLQEIQNGVAGGGQIARMGSMLSSAMRNINANLTRSNTGLIFCNQYRISPGNYGNPFVEVGGEAIKYYTALKIELTKGLDKDKDSKEVFGLNIKASITKSKVGVPYGKAEYYIEFGKGIVRWREVMDIAVDREIITKEGNTYSFEGNKLGVGLGQLEECLQDNPELLEKLEIKVLDLLNNKIEVKDEGEIQEIITEGSSTNILQEG